MLIPVDRPIVDARNIAAAAMQTVSGDDVGNPALVHNHRATLRVTLTGSGVHEQGTTVQAIQSGVRIGQRLRIIVVDNGSGALLRIIDDAGTAKTALRGKWQSGTIETPTTYGSYIDLEWSGTLWVEVERYDGIDWSAGGKASHAEGDGTSAGGQSSHAEGEDTSASGWAAHAEGRYGTASGVAAHKEGYNCTASGHSAHAEGRETTASGDYTHAEGYKSAASGISSHAEGAYAEANLYGEHAQAAGRFAANGDAQFSRVLMRKGTTDATLTEIFIDGADDRITILDEYTYACKVTVVGRQDTGVDHFMGTYHVLIERTGGTVALVGAIDIVYENNAGGLGAGGGLPVAITADDTNKSLKIAVEGLAAHDIRWVAVVEMVRVGHSD